MMLPGDVLLLAGQGKLSSSLIKIQKAVYKKAQSSHVEFSMGDGIFLHSTGDRGVHFSLLIDEDVDSKGKWRIIRHKSIINNPELVESLSRNCLFYLHQKYNKGFYGKGNNHSSFCSELVAKAFNKTGIKIFDGRDPSKVAPAHFDEAADSLLDWDDVTEEYRSQLTSMREMEFHLRLSVQFLTFILTRRMVLEPYRLGLLKILDGNMSQDTIHELEEILKKRELSFWYENNNKPKQ